MKKRSHELKATPESFCGVTQGTNLAQVRFNDRDFKPGDELYLREYLPEFGYYSSACTRVDVTEVLKDMPGIVPGYCVLSIKLRYGQIRERGPGGYEEKKDVQLGPPVQQPAGFHTDPADRSIDWKPRSDSAGGVGIGDLERNGSGSHPAVSGGSGLVAGLHKRSRKNSGGRKQVQKHRPVASRVRNRKGARKA